MKINKEKTLIKLGVNLIWQKLKELPEDKALNMFSFLIAKYEEEAPKLGIMPLGEEFNKVIFEIYHKPKRKHSILNDYSKLPERLKINRMIEEIKKPSELAYIAVAAEISGIYDFTQNESEQGEKKVDFYRMAFNRIGERAGSQRTFNQVFNRLKYKNLKKLDLKKLETLKNKILNTNLQKELDLIIKKYIE